MNVNGEETTKCLRISNIKIAPQINSQHKKLNNTYRIDAGQLKHITASLHDALLEIIDILMSCLIVAPCVIAYWRGTWEYINLLLFPKNVPLSAFCSFLIGGLGHMLFSLTQRYFTINVHPDKHRLTFYIISRLYTYAYGIICVNMWRGSWVLCDWLTSANSLYIICIVTLISIIFLISTRTVRNLAAAPFSIIMDHKSDYFIVETMFKTSNFQNQDELGLYIMDTLFSVFVIGTLVVIAWRGLWGIVDLTLYPSDRTKSASYSLLMGAITAAIIFTLYPFMRWLTKHLDGLCKLITLDIYYFAQFFASINIWRSIWILLDVYLYPDNRLLSLGLTHTIPFLILTALKCSNSILVRGVFVDCIDINNNNDCVNIPIHYIKLHFQRERDKRNYIIMMNSHQKSNLLKHQNEQQQQQQQHQQQQQRHHQHQQQQDFDMDDNAREEENAQCSMLWHSKVSEIRKHTVKA